MDTIIQDSQVSYYKQLYIILRNDIARGVWKPGDRIPSEAELIDIYGVSRITVRQAFELLVNDGLVYRRRGSGTFVAAAEGEKGARRMTDIDEELRRLGLEPETRVLTATLRPATAEIAARMGVEAGVELAVLERLWLADGEPMSLERVHFVHRFCPGLLAAIGETAGNAAVREALLVRYGIRLTRTRQSVRAVAADGPVAAALAVAVGMPVLAIERISFQQAGLPIEYFQASHRGDRYILNSELRM